jgi:drug/metabolite transporter (DMT)-like permease
MIVARLVANDIPPVTLAFTRWLAAVLVLLPFIGFKLYKARAVLAKEWKQLLMLGSLGMGICGAFPYIGAQTTTATNIGLIYALSPIFVILFARMWYAVHLNKRQLLGVVFAFVGVIVIVAKGELNILLQLEFSVGDLWILSASASWGFYSLWQGHLKSQLSLFLRFSAMSLGGVIALAPFSLIEVYQQLPLTYNAQFMHFFMITIAFLALISSIVAYAAYAQIQTTLGASKASLVMYAIPLYNAALAWLILDEKLQTFHLIGAALILPGLFLAVSKKKA